MAHKRAVSSEDSTSQNDSLPVQEAKRVAKRKIKTNVQSATRETKRKKKRITTADQRRAKRRSSVETCRSVATTVLKGIIKLPRKRSAPSPTPSQKRVHFNLPPMTSSEDSDRCHKKPRRESRSKERRRPSHSSRRAHQSTSSSSSSSSGERNRRRVKKHVRSKKH
ncbi:hypothetical protein MRX96_017288 [Rhipicephalus microplus]